MNEKSTQSAGARRLREDIYFTRVVHISVGCSTWIVLTALQSLYELTQSGEVDLVKFQILSVVPRSASPSRFTFSLMLKSCAATYSPRWPSCAAVMPIKDAVNEPCWAPCSPIGRSAGADWPLMSSAHAGSPVGLSAERSTHSITGK